MKKNPHKNVRVNDKIEDVFLLIGIFKMSNSTAACIK